MKIVFLWFFLYFFLLSFLGGAHTFLTTAYFLFFIFKRCSRPSHHRLLSLFYFQAVLMPSSPPPTFAFLFSGGAHTFLTTAYFRFFIFRWCTYPSHHRLLSLFYFQAVLIPSSPPPIFAFLFSGGAHTLHTTAYFRFSIFRRCSYRPHHRLLSLFHFQAVLIPSSPPPTFSFLFLGGAHTLHITTYFRFSIFRWCSYPSHHRLLSLFLFPGGAHTFLTTAYFRFFIFRRCSRPSHHRLLSLFYFQAVLTPHNPLPRHDLRNILHHPLKNA
ncbi:MAG: hypothetical protein IJZ00_04735 [Lachnospiraceae bacterium]|nr:hypothetical protein [Lachnospiraceae bacterium]